MPRIFVSYRRVDSAAIAGRIYDRLNATFGSDVFKDSYSIKPGDDFRDAIRKAVTNVDVLIVVIGPDWLHVTLSDGTRRLDAPEDWVRSEVEAGLQSRTTTVIPVLVGGALPPAPASLPVSIRELAYRNALQVRDDPDFHRDMDVLIQILRSLDAQQQSTKTAVPPITAAKSERSLAVVIAVIGAIATIIAAAIGILPALLNQPMPTPPPTATLQAVVASETPTDSPTLTTAPTDRPTDTSIPSSSVTPTATHTALPPTAAPTNTPQPTTTPSTDFALTIFRDTDSFTLYVPASDEPYSLKNLAFLITLGNGGQVIRFLDRDFSAFLGLNYENIDLGTPLCFRLLHQQSTAVTPLDCTTPDVVLFTQTLVASDMFWYNDSTNQERTVTVLKDGATLGICAAGQSTCEIGVVLPDSIDSLQLSDQCTSVIKSENQSVTLPNVVRAGPGRANPLRSPVPVGQVVIIDERARADNLYWYRVSDEQGSYLGWIPETHLGTPSQACRF